MIDRFQAELDREEAEADKARLESEQACRKLFPVRYRDATTDHADILEWVEGFRDYDSDSMLLLGPTGTGKTHHAYAALRLCAARVWRSRAGIWLPPRWKAMTFADLIASLRPRGRDYDPEEVLESYVKAHLLLVDDLGAGKLTDFVEESTYRILNARYNAVRPTIYTSNLALPALKDAIGDRIASRLAEDCKRVILDGPDRRRTTTRKEAP